MSHKIETLLTNDVEQIIPDFASAPDTFALTDAECRNVLAGLQALIGRPLTEREAHNALQAAEGEKYNAEAIAAVLRGEAVLLPRLNPHNNHLEGSPSYLWNDEIPKFGDDARCEYERDALIRKAVAQRNVRG